MSEHEALARFDDLCGARHRKAETRRRWRSRCMMHPQRSPTNVLIRTGSCAEGGLILRRRPLTNRIVKEI